MLKFKEVPKTNLEKVSEEQYHKNDNSEFSKHMHQHGLIDFFEPCHYEKTIFAYSDTRRFYM